MKDRSRQAGADVSTSFAGGEQSGIEVTKKMREAGAEVLGRLSGVVSSEYLAEAVYIAMASARPH